MKKIKYLLCMALLTIGISAVPLSVSFAKVDINTAKKETAIGACKQKGGSTDSDGQNCNKSGSSLTGVFQTVVNIMLFLVGAVAVIMLIIGGFRYVASNGDATAVKGAKDTILYAIIGIVVAFLAYAAVNFVTDQLVKGAKSGSSTIHKTSMV